MGGEARGEEESVRSVEGGRKRGRVEEGWGRGGGEESVLRLEGEMRGRGWGRGGEESV